jgi:ABC-2 type transport system permease protein
MAAAASAVAEAGLRPNGDTAMSALPQSGAASPRREHLGLLLRELRLLLRSRMAVAALGLLGVLSLAACLNGLHQVRAQTAAIEQARALQAESAELLMARYGSDQEPGIISYHRFVLSWDAPAALGFAAIGQRDIAPWLLRVRALGLQAQLYEGEHANAELALAGRFDFAFVLVYLTPLVLIALLHDLISSEREAGRLRLLQSLPEAGRGLWRRRAGLRVAAVWVVSCAPACGVVVLAGAPLLQGSTLLAISALYLLFWSGLCLWLGARERSSGTHAAHLVGAWLLLCLVLPTLGQAALQRALPAESGMDLMLAQREEVHAGWDRPKPETFERFFQDHPEWRDTAPVLERFHWKWYYALQHAGDWSVREQVADYRSTIEARERGARQLGWLLPGVAVQAAVHRLAASDLQAHLAYLDRVASFHRELRVHLYPYVFDELPWTAADAACAPVYRDAEGDSELPLQLWLMLLIAAGVGIGLGRRGLRRIAG